MIPRVLVLLLLAMNAAVAIWWVLRPPPEAPVVAATEDGMPSLRLLGEVEPIASAEPAAPPESAADAALLSCWELGPFVARGELKRVFDALLPAVERIQYREMRVRSERGWWVYLPATDDREAALRTARELAARGVSDYYVVTAGASQNTVSLGLFRDRDNAEQRRREIAALGFDAEIAARTDEVPNYWIAIAVTEGTDWRERLGGYTGVDAEPIACD